MRAPEFWYRQDLPSRSKAIVLAPLGWIYGSSIAWKSYLSKPYRTRAKVVCVGNLTVGGSGKTPVALALAECLQRQGYDVAFLSRGYGGRMKGPILVDPARHSAADVGDEPLLLAKNALTVISRDRAAGAKLCDAQGADVIITDDGHQNFSLKKDLSIVVVDAEAGFGNGFVLPAGPLREPIEQGLARADAVILMGTGEIDLAGFSKPVVRARLTPVGNANSKPYIAFAGIGRPEKFFSTLRDLGIDLRKTRPFDDHHFYSEQEIFDLRKTALTLGVGLITTRKDFVRLPEKYCEGIEVLDVEAAFECTDVLNNLISRLKTSR